MTTPKNTANTEVKPKQISKEEADRIDDYAQGLDDEITQVVDYGGVEEPKEKK